MRSLHVFIFGFVGIVLIFIFIFFRFNILSAGFNFRSALKGIFGTSVDYSLYKTIIAERKGNNTKKFNGNGSEKVDLGKYKALKTLVYSRYPFNNKSLLIVQGGSEDGVKPLMPALLGENVLFGKVVNVSRTQSEIETIFNPSWKSSVYIGSSKIKAVLNGGDTPTLKFIKKNSKIKKGDYVVNSSPEFPINLFIGTISSVRSQEHELWTTAKIDIDYSFDDVRDVFVITNFP